MGVGEDNLQLFEDYINSFQPSLNLQLSSRVHINFLDIKKNINDGFITTDFYTKDTDAFAYLHYNSCHPNHCKGNISYSQLLRARHLCSEPRDYTQQDGNL